MIQNRQNLRRYCLKIIIEDNCGGWYGDNNVSRAVGFDQIEAVGFKQALEHFSKLYPELVHNIMSETISLN